MSKFIGDLEGSETTIDDILVYGRMDLEHDENLKETLKRIKTGW